MLKDKDIREPLFEFLEEKYGKVRIIEEKQIGKSRADVVMVTPDSLYGIEIKSDADTYVRLAKQVKNYNRFFDYNLVAVGSTHAVHATEHVPDDWGIVSIEEKSDGSLDFYMVREPLPNPKRRQDIKFRNQMSMLWRMELAHLQEINGFHKYAAKSKQYVMLYLIEHVPEEILKKQLCNELFERDYSTVSQRIEEYKVAKAEKTAKAKAEKNTEAKNKSTTMKTTKQAKKSKKDRLLEEMK